jgi:hypothetical protein
LLTFTIGSVIVVIVALVLTGYVDICTTANTVLTIVVVLTESILIHILITLPHTVTTEWATVPRFGLRSHRCVGALTG